ncbi:MAG: hypothetical protein U0470_02640 [Anaerolineae bacterium]
MMIGSLDTPAPLETANDAPRGVSAWVRRAARTSPSSVLSSPNTSR